MKNIAEKLEKIEIKPLIIGRLEEVFRNENLTGSWKFQQLLEMENEFNALEECREDERKIILYNFFQDTIIASIFIHKLKVISEDAIRIDIRNEQFSKMHRAHIMSDCLLPFSDITFGPPSKTKKEKKHDAHVKKFALQKVPPPYVRKYPNTEPKLTASIERSETRENCYQISIKRLVKTSGFCSCIKMSHREIMSAVQLKDVFSIKMHWNAFGSYDLYIETIQ